MFLVLTGCAEQPVLQFDAAIQALEEARVSGAEDYAIEIFTEAESAYGQAKEELNQQQERLQPFRDYHPAMTLLAKVRLSAEQAKMEALDNKKEAKANAEAALDFAKLNLQTVRSLLADSTIPLTDQRQYDQITLAFQATETLLSETESIMSEENYIGVMTTAHSVESFATRIQEHILSARQLAKKRQV
jgi:phage terminase Nu1 subunit (DNA packaging protein)